MATFGNWKEKREYRVWAGEDNWATATVSQNIKNGRVRVDVEGEDETYHTRSLEDGYRYASAKADELMAEAKAACPCEKYGDDDCKNADTNPYGYAHGVRLQVVDMETGYALEPWEL